VRLQLAQRAPGRRGVEALTVVVDVLPELDQKPVVDVRACVDEVGGRRDRRARSGEPPRERQDLREPVRAAKPRERHRHTRDDGRRLEVHEHVGEVAHDARLLRGEPLIARHRHHGRNCPLAWHVHHRNLSSTTQDEHGLPERAERRDAASSVASVASGYACSLRSCPAPPGAPRQRVSHPERRS
jgi:hypothetical protein